MPSPPERVPTAPPPASPPGHPDDGRQTVMAEPPNKEFEPWRSMDNYNDKRARRLAFENPLPKFDGNPWAEALKGLSGKDTARCKAWIEEIENLLIFAGLFSAIVTAFVVESYKGLQPDSDQASIDVLLRIASHLEGRTSPTSYAVLKSTSPSLSTVRVNALWFLSLVVSLTAVLVGIVCAQWLRVHLLPTRTLSPGPVELSLHHMYEKALDKWYVPQIFAALPLLLLLGLVLFFVGLVDFLWHLNHVVAIPSLVAIGLTLLFLLATTSLPAIQELALYLPRWSSSPEPRSPCPYRSPQSWAFLKATLPLLRVINKVIINPSKKAFTRPLVANESPLAGDQDKFHPDNDDNFIDWSTYGQGWLRERDRNLETILAVDAQSSENSRAQSEKKEDIPHYDLIHALSGILAVVENRPAYHCLNRLSFLWKDEFSGPLQKLVSEMIESQAKDHDLYEFRQWFSKVLQAPYPVEQDVKRLLFLPSDYAMTNSNGRPHAAEICIRIAHWLTFEDHEMVEEGWTSEFEIWDALDTQGSVPGVSEQLIYMLLNFFQLASRIHPTSFPSRPSTHTSGMIWRFIDTVVRAATPQELRMFEDKIQDVLDSRFPSKANYDWYSSEAQQLTDYLFVTFSCYLCYVQDFKKNSDELQILHPRLQPYAEHIKRRNGQDRTYLSKLVASMGLHYELDRVWKIPYSYFLFDEGSTYSVEDEQHPDLHDGTISPGNNAPLSKWETKSEKAIGRIIPDGILAGSLQRQDTEREDANRPSADDRNMVDTDDQRNVQDQTDDVSGYPATRDQRSPVLWSAEARRVTTPNEAQPEGTDESQVVNTGGIRLEAVIVEGLVLHGYER